MVTYNFSKTAGGPLITSSDNSWHQAITNANITIGPGQGGTTVNINFGGLIPTLDLGINQIGTINGSAPPSTIIAIIDLLQTTVFPKAAPGVGSVSPGAWYLRWDLTTLNSVRIIISGTDVNLQKYNGTSWVDVTTIGGPV